jgi:cell division topological specificity factor
VLREDILAAIGKHVAVDADKVNVEADRADKVSTLTIVVEIPRPLTQNAE